MSSEKETPKIGAGHAAAMYRQGLAELRAALYPESNVAQPAQYGLYGTRTPGEVAEARRSEGLERDEEARGAPAELDRRQEAEGGRDNREPPEPERE